MLPLIETETEADHGRGRPADRVPDGDRSLAGREPAAARLLHGDYPRNVR